MHHFRGLGGCDAALAHDAFGLCALRKLTAVTDATGNRMTYTLNAAGERIKDETKDSA